MGGEGEGDGDGEGVGMGASMQYGWAYPLKRKLRPQKPSEEGPTL